MSLHFFIDRPKFSFVISIVITLLGLLCITVLPISQFPEIAPPQVQVSTTYPGASSEILRDTVASPLESQMNGVEDMIYMSSNSSNDGSYTLTVSFAIGTDSDIAQVNVQNRVSQVESMMPEEVKRQGITVKKKSSDMLLTVNLFSPNETYDGLYLSNFADINVRDELARIPGVSDATIMGQLDYGMRIWLNPERMSSLNITSTDIYNVIREQNVQVPAGQIGAAPAPEGQQFQYSVQTQGRLEDVEQFENIIIRSRDDGSAIYLSDVARIELGSQYYSAFASLENKPSSMIAIYQLPGANALEIADKIHDRMEKLKERFPNDMEYDIIYDSTDFVRTSIKEVVITLFQAVLLVILVVFIFLQDWRSTLIPALAIPVSLIGTFAFLLLLDMSINTVSLFALILAIGIVVDDAIVVIENVKRHMDETGLSPVEATKRTMDEVSGPVIATTLVLLAVFAPVGLMPGLTGQMYKQFAVTISISVLISSVNALTLSPALCASLLKPGKSKPGKFFTGFNKYFDKLTNGYMRIVGFLLRRLSLAAMIAVGLLVATGLIATSLPTGFIPDEDVGYFMVDIQLPDGAALERTEKVVEKTTAMISEEPGINSVITVTGFSLLNGSVSSNSGMMIVVLENWEERQEPELEQFYILRKVQQMLATVPEARISAFQTPPIPGIGTAGGFEFMLEDLQGRSPEELAAAMGGLIVAANQDPVIGAAYSTFRAGVPRIELDLDRQKAKNLGVPLSDIFDTLQAQLGSLYVNDFNKFGKVYRVMIQAEDRYRNDESDINSFYVRNNDGQMVPIATFVQSEPALGPEILTRYNLYNAARINGGPARGHSSGEAVSRMEQLAAQTLPPGYTFEWTGMTYQELAAGNLAPIIFSLAIIFVFLFLVAQYESWSIPLAIIFSVPMALLGAFFMVFIMRSEVNLYTQIGLVLLIGLSSKAAILIVEFAKEKREVEKMPILEAARQAAHLRFRAVLMTVLSFVLGVFPLVVATGAGAASRNSLGEAIFGGAIAAGIFGTIMVPIFFAIIQKTRERFKGIPPDES